MLTGLRCGGVGVEFGGGDDEVAVGVRRMRDGGGKLIAAHVHRPVDNTRVAVEVRRGQ